MDVTRLQSGRLMMRPQMIDLAVLVRSVWESYAEAHARETEYPIQVPDRAIHLDGDPVRLQQVLENLLTNTAKYSPDGGQIGVLLQEANDGGMLTVTDTGIGLPPGEQERIFEPSGRATNATYRGVPGMGFGLYICRRIVESHRGTIWVHSAGEGRRTTLSVWLPAGPADNSQRAVAERGNE